MSVYNGERWLRESINSILEQTFTDFEFIIVNDGSLDSSVDIIKQFSVKDSRIRFIDKPNTGLADSLNVGINNANGKWIARIDADDICEPQRLQLQYSFAESNNEIVLLGSGHFSIDEFGSKTNRYVYPITHNNLVKKLISFRGFFPHSSAFIRRDVLLEIGCYRVRIYRSQDYDLWLRLSEIGKIACLSEPLVQIRCHMNQISNIDSGDRQIIDAHTSVASYFLRKLHYPDPVSNENSDSNFLHFREFVVQGLIDNNLFKYRHFISHIKKISEDKKKYRLFLILLLLIKSPSFVFRYLFELFRGENVTYDIVKSWVRNNN